MPKTPKIPNASVAGIRSSASSRNEPSMLSDFLSREAPEELGRWLEHISRVRNQHRHDANAADAVIVELLNAGLAVWKRDNPEEAKRFAEQSEQAGAPQPRTPGLLGEFRVGDEFFEPLSEDELRLWEGRRGEDSPKHSDPNGK